MAPFLNIHWSSVLTVLFDCYLAGATWNCCHPGTRYILGHLCRTCVQMMPRSEVWHTTCRFVRNNHHCTIIINTQPAHIVGVTTDTEMKVPCAGSPKLSKVVSLKPRVNWNIILHAWPVVRNPTFQNQQTQELIIAYGNSHLACE